MPKDAIDTWELILDDLDALAAEMMGLVRHPGGHFLLDKGPNGTMVEGYRPTRDLIKAWALFRKLDQEKKTYLNIRKDSNAFGVDQFQIYMWNGDDSTTVKNEQIEVALVRACLRLRGKDV